MSRSPIVPLLQEKRVLVVAGAGGVGKTTVAAALALSAASQGQQVLCLTIDPAKRLFDRLGLNATSEAEQIVDPAPFAAAGLPMKGSLTLVMLDTKRTFDDLVRKHASEPEVAERMLVRGAHLVNDVSCLAEPELAAVCARHGATLLVMHSRGPMSAMAGFSVFPESAYGDVVSDVLAEWRAARDRAVGRGMPADRVWLDPGIGFGKSARHSFALLRGLARFAREEVPIVIGASRKSFMTLADQAPPDERLGGSIAATLLAVRNGASVVRVHDVREVRQALAVAHAIQDPSALEARHA